MPVMFPVAVHDPPVTENELLNAVAPTVNVPEDTATDVQFSAVQVTVAVFHVAAPESVTVPRAINNELLVIDDVVPVAMVRPVEIT